MYGRLECWPRLDRLQEVPWPIRSVCPTEAALHEPSPQGRDGRDDPIGGRLFPRRANEHVTDEGASHLPCDASYRDRPRGRPYEQVNGRSMLINRLPREVIFILGQPALICVLQGEFSRLPSVQPFYCNACGKLATIRDRLRCESCCALGWTDAPMRNIEALQNECSAAHS